MFHRVGHAVNLCFFGTFIGMVIKDFVLKVSIIVFTLGVSFIIGWWRTATSWATWCS